VRLDGKKVLREREVRGLNAHEGAKLIGISVNALLNAEHGDGIQQRTARKIASAYGLAVADLYPEPRGNSGADPGEPLSRAAQAAVRRAEEHLEALRDMSPEDCEEEAQARTWEVVNDLLDEILDEEPGSASQKELGKPAVLVLRTTASLLRQRSANKHKQTART
jgi:transcriptional regulator with XRE-family HTH domain